KRCGDARGIGQTDALHGQIAREVGQRHAAAQQFQRELMDQPSEPHVRSTCRTGGYFWIETVFFEQAGVPAKVARESQSLPLIQGIRSRAAIADSAAPRR